MMSGGMGKMIFGILMIVVALIMFPIVLTAVHTITSDTYIADYTGLEQLAGLSPLLIFIGLLGGGGWLTFQGFRSGGGGGKSRKKH